MFGLYSLEVDLYWVWLLLQNTHSSCLHPRLGTILRSLILFFLWFCYAILFEFFIRVFISEYFPTPTGGYSTLEPICWGWISSFCTRWGWRCQKHYKLCAGKIYVSCFSYSTFYCFVYDFVAWSLIESTSFVGFEITKRSKEQRVLWCLISWFGE